MSIPKFQQQADAIFASVEMLQARLTDSAPQQWHMVYRLHVRAANGTVSHIDFTSVSSRNLALIPLKRQPVDLRCEDVAVTS